MHYTLYISHAIFLQPTAEISYAVSYYEVFNCTRSYFQTNDTRLVLRDVEGNEVPNVMHRMAIVIDM